MQDPRPTRLELALEAALLVTRNGGSTVAAQRTFANMLKGSDQQGLTTVARLDFFAAGDGMTTVLRSVGPTGINLARASEAEVLSQRAAAGDVPFDVVAGEIERIKRLASPYPRWMTVIAAAGACASFSQIPGGDWGSFGIDLVAGAAGQSLRLFLQTRGIAAAPTILACGLVSALIAAFGLRCGFSQVESATLIASVAYMFPGLTLINGFFDVISHRHLVIGFERMLNAAFLYMILALSIAFASAVIAF